MGFPLECPDCRNAQSRLQLRGFLKKEGEFGEFSNFPSRGRNKRTPKWGTILPVGICWNKLTKLTRCL
jgi:hypothetical protein